MESIKKDNLLQCIFLLITEQLLLFPISFAVLTLLDIKSAGIYGIFLIVSIALMLVRSLLAGLKRPYAVFIFTAIILLFSIYWSNISWKAVVIAVFGVFIEIRALSLIERPFNSFNFYIFTSTGFFAYIFAAIFYNKAELIPYMDILALCATLSAIFSCICMNMSLVGYEKAVGNRTGNIPRLSRKSNRMMLTIFVTLMLVLTALGFADRVYAFLGVIINAVFTFLNSLFSDMLAPGNPLGEEQRPPEIAEEIAASPFWVIFEEIMKIFIGIALVAGVLYLIYLLLRYLKKHYRQFLKKLWDRICTIIRTFLFGKGQMENDDLGYEDEITSLMMKNESLFSATRRWFKSRSKEGRPYVMLMDNVQRARWLYGHIVQKDIKKGFALKRTMTPRQILSHINKSKINDEVAVKKAISCYNKARYGIHAPDDSEIDALRFIHRNR